MTGLARGDSRGTKVIASTLAGLTLRMVLLLLFAALFYKLSDNNVACTDRHGGNNALFEVVLQGNESIFLTNQRLCTSVCRYVANICSDVTAFIRVAFLY